MKTDYYWTEEYLKGKFPCHLETPGVNPTGESNAETLQVSLLNIFQGSSACVIWILPLSLIKWIMRPYLFPDFLIVLNGGYEFRVLLLRLSKAVPLPPSHMHNM